MHNGAAEGTEPGEYAEGSKATLQTAIEAANAIATKENVTKAEVDKGVADLQTAVDAFKAGKVPAPTPATAEEIKVLTDAVASANTLHDGATEGTEPGEYAEGSKATLQTVIEAANAIAKKENVTKAEVDKGIADLQTAVDAFKAGKVPAPTPATAEEIKVLTDAVAAANTLHNGAAEGTEPGQYAEGSKVTLKTVIDAVDAVAKKENVTKAEVDKGVADLQTAVNAFKAGKVPEPAPSFTVSDKNANPDTVATISDISGLTFTSHKDFIVELSADGGNSWSTTQSVDGQTIGSTVGANDGNGNYDITFSVTTGTDVNPLSGSTILDIRVTIGGVIVDNAVDIQVNNDGTFTVISNQTPQKN